MARKVNRTRTPENQPKECEVRKTTKHGRKPDAYDKLNNPVARAVARKRIDKMADVFAEQMTSLISSTRILLYMAQDGEDATELLAQLLEIIGPMCECGARQWPDAPWVKQLHGQLRTIESMCLSGYRWNSEYADAMDRAVELAVEVRPDLDVEIFSESWQGAVVFAKLIRKHLFCKGIISETTKG